MGKRFAVEWLWFMGSAVAAGLWVFLSGAESDSFGVVLGAIWVGFFVYLASGLIRLTITAIKTVWPR